MRPRSSRSLCLWITLVCTALLLRQTVEYGFVGQDTYPILAACRVQSSGDVLALFGERLMGGTHNLFRPFFNVTIAVDELAFGLWAPGYHVTSALFFAACALSAGLLAGRLLGPRAHAAPLVATLAFLLFPAHFEVLPVVSRRPDTMVFAFTCLALWAQLSERALGARGWASRPLWTPAVLALLAMGSKDNGLLVEPLCFLAVLLYSPRRGARDRLAHAARAMVPHVALTALFLLARSAVVVGLGGLQSRDTWAQLASYPERVGGMLRTLVLPERTLEPAPLTAWLTATLAIAFVAACAAGPRRRTEDTTNAGRAAVLGLAWLALLTLMYTTREVWRGWYVFQLLAPWVLLLAAAAQHSLGVLRCGSAVARALSGVVLTLLALTLGWNGRTSPLLHRYTEWSEQSAAVGAFYSELGRRVEAAALPALVEVPPFPPHHGVPPTDRPFVQVTRNVTRNSIRAWCELTAPGVRARTVHSSQARLRPKDELVLVSDEFPRRERQGARGE